MAILKKWTAILFLLILLLPSCIVKEIYEVTETNEVGPNTFSKDYTVNQNQWLVGDDDESGVYFYYEFREPNLTQFIYEKGIMQAFLIMNGQNISPLPFDDYWIDGNYRWTEHVTCEFRPGYVTFILKYNDHTLDTPYYVYRFRVKFLW